VGAIDAVTQPGNAAPCPQVIGNHHGRTATVEHLGQHPVGQPARAAVERPFEDAETGGHHGVRVRTSRRRDARGQCGRRQVVVDEQDHGGVQALHCRSDGGSRGQPRPQALGDRVSGRSVAADRRQRIDEGGNQRPAGGRDHLVGQVETQRIGQRRGRHRDAQPIGQPGVRR